MMKEIKSELKNIRPTPKNLKNFGLLVGMICVLLSLAAAINREIIFWLLILGALLIISGIFSPSWLKYGYFVWMGFSVIAGFFVFRLILIILFFLVLTPTAAVMKMFGKDNLGEKFGRKEKSYWRGKEKSADLKSEAEHLF